jgi:hypothetical protein
MKKNDSLVDLCELQHEERQKRDNRLTGNSDDEQNLCRNKPDELVSDLEAFPYKSNEYNQLLTDADRSWIITHTQSEIFHIKFVRIFSLIDRRRRRKNLKDYLRKNHEIFTLQVNISLNFN